MPEYRSIEEKLRNYVEEDGPLPTKCWIWQGPPQSRGYGHLWWEGKQWLAHRASWIYHVGPIPDDLLCLHKCSSQRLCINPDHLYLGTPQDNVDDKMRDGAHAALAGEANGFACLTDAQVELIKFFLQQGWSQSELARRYGVNATTIRRIQIETTWLHVAAFKPIPGQPLPVPPPIGPPTYRRFGATKGTENVLR